MRKFSFLLALVFVLSTFLTACGGSKAKDELIIANLSEAVSLDPHGSNDVPSSNVAHNIYEALVYQDEKMNVQPSLATEWKAVDDLTWEFKLRQNVKFHDGSPFNAEVVKANLERIMDPDVASPRSFLYEMITDIIIVDEYTVQLKTEYPFAPLPAHLAHSGGSMISLEAINKDYEMMALPEGKAGDFISLNPVGTGFFKLDEWIPGEQIKLIRNEDYWGNKAKVKSIIFKTVPESLTRISELETGYAHIIDPVSPSDMTRVDNLENAGMYRQSSLSLSYLGFNAAKAPFDDVRVRQAISMAVNKQEIIDGIYEGTGIPAVGPLAPDVFAYDPTVSPLPYDIDKAKELLAEAGFPNGFKTSIWTNDNPVRIQIAEYLQSKLKDINLDVEVEVVEWGAYLEQTANGQHDMFILGWSTATADADYAMFPIFHSSNFGEAGNRTFLYNERLDEILTQARQEPSPDTRIKLYREAQEILVDLAPMVYLIHTEYLLGVQDSVEGFWVHPSGIFQLRDVSIK